MAKQGYIDLKLPSIMGMGAVGPTLAIITATLYSALCMANPEPPAWGYPVIMLVLSGLLAVFPVMQSTYPKWQKACLWPVTAAIIFSTAWGTNHGLSVGEEALSQPNGAETSWNWRDFSLVSTAYAGTNAPVMKRLVPPILNRVDFSRVDYGTKEKANQNLFKAVGKTVWGLQWPKSKEVYLKDGSGVWYKYRLKTVSLPKPEPKSDPAQQIQQRGGFFKRF